MILGRSANLFLGLATAAVALVWGIAAQAGTPLSAELETLLVAFLSACIVLVAGSDTMAVKKGDAAAARIASRIKGK